jgi:hypothetical protein
VAGLYPLGATIPLPASQVYAPIMDLPHILGFTLDSIPPPIRLTPDAGLIERWRPGVEAVPGFRIGAAWRGSPDTAHDAKRSFPLEALSPLDHVPGISLISLQKGRGSEELAACRFPVVDLGRGYQDGDFQDTAAILSHLDLIITCDTSVAHLAGTLGRNAWLAHHTPAEWRWMVDREDSPWYPTLRLFRQSRPGDWAPVFQRMAEELRRLLGDDRAVRSPR